VSELFASGRIVDAILALIVVEGVLLTLLNRQRGVGLAPADLLGVLASGAALLLALRSALVGAPWTSTAAWLAAALIAHLVDLARRWR
jgi:hypothetical protein